MMYPIPSGRGWPVVVFTSCIFAQAFREARAAGPSALSVPIDGARWIGYDGTWSPVTVQVGSPVQAIDLFPNTAGQETLVVGLDGCDGTVQCETARGGTFAANQSSTFASLGDYSLGLDTNLGLLGAGYYGFDTINIGSQESLKKQVIGVVNSTQYWIGSLGLGTANTTVGALRTTSFLETLAGASSPIIPSLSYGFTMGASYRLKQVPCSLTLGGYDASRLLSNDASFALDGNQRPSIALTSLSMNGFGSAGNVSLMGTGGEALFVIDSTDPFLWFPDIIATQIGDELGLIYNDTLGVFLYPNASQYQAVTSSSLTFNFGFSDLPGNPTSLSLDIPGEAFTSLNLSYGFPGLGGSANDPPIPYFPVRKAANSSQYTLGRALLQETYLIVDYERNNFSLSQAAFSVDSGVNLQLINIEPPPNKNSINGTIGPVSNNATHPASSVSLSVGAAVGVAIAVAVVVAVLVCGIAICLIRRYGAKRVAAVRPEDGQLEPRSGISRVVFGDYKIPELAAREFAPSPIMAMSKLIDDPKVSEWFNDAKPYRGHVPITIAGFVRELPGSGNAASELPGDGYQQLMAADQRPWAPVELPVARRAGRTGLAEIALLASRMVGKQEHPKPSPTSSIGPTGTYLTVSAVDSSEVRSPQGPINSALFTSPLLSEKSSVTPLIQSRDASQGNSANHSRKGSSGHGKSAGGNRERGGSVCRDPSHKTTSAATNGLLSTDAERAAGSDSKNLPAISNSELNNGWRWKSLPVIQDQGKFETNAPGAARHSGTPSRAAVELPTCASPATALGRRSRRDDRPPRYPGFI